MKKFLSLISGLIIIASAYNFNIYPGWQLKGALSDINISKFNNSKIVSVWTYDYQNHRWKAYFPNKGINLNKYGIENLKIIKKGEGFWINASSTIVIDNDKIIKNNEYNGNNLNNTLSDSVLPSI